MSGDDEDDNVDDADFDGDDDGDEDEAFEARYRERRERMLNTPPTCLAAFAAERATHADLPGVAFDGHGEPDESIFRVRCKCGAGDALRVRGTFHAKDWRGDPLNFFGDPLELTCESCGRTLLLFDADRHGYNAEIDAADGLLKSDAKDDDADGGGERKTYACPHCGGEPMHLWARFEHSGETCEDSFSEQMTANREQDFFSWFTLVGRCAKCGKLETVTEFECA